MNFTDSDLTNVKVKNRHLTEMQLAIQDLITNNKISVNIGSLNSLAPDSESYLKLQKAVNILESSFSNNCCQSCETYTACQSCQSCQAQCNCNCDCADDNW